MRPPPDPTSRSFYHSELDVLRFLAFLSVFLHHAVPAAINVGTNSLVASVTEVGAYGVDLFFVLSSYLITELLLREHRHRGAIDIPSFYVRRTLRIWPLYFFFIALTVFVVPAVLPSDRLRGTHLAAFVLFAGNWSIAVLGYPGSVAAPLWSVSMEEQFYLAWPLIVRSVGGARLRALCFGMIGIASLTRLTAVALDSHHPSIWTNTFARLDPIAGGALLAAVLRGRAPQLSTPTRTALWLLALLSLVSVARYGSLAGPKSLFTYPVVSAACVILLFATLRDGELPAFWRSPTAVYLGRISYGLYVYHVLAIALAGRFGIGSDHSPVLRIGIVFAITSIFAYLSYELLEKPFLQLKRRFTHVQSGPSAAAAPLVAAG